MSYLKKFEIKTSKGFIVKESNVWGSASSKDDLRVLKSFLIKKGTTSPWHPIIDHEIIYSMRKEGEKGRANDNQTFMISYAYNKAGDCDKCGKEIGFNLLCERAGLRVVKDPYWYRQIKDSYRFIILDKDVDLESLLEVCEELKFRSGI